MSASRLPTVLVVDDNVDIVDSLCELLRVKGYGVASAVTVSDALAVLDECPSIQTVFSDIRMPEVDGFDFLRVVKHRYPAIQVVLITGESITDEDVVPPGAVVLTKPVEFDALLRLLPPAID